MKKKLVLAGLALAICTSVVAGTMAVYATQLDNLATESNQVVAKQFVLTGAGVDTFNDTVKIAPTETVEKSFTISNFDNTVITETAMDVEMTIALAAADGKPIAGLAVQVSKNGTPVGAGVTDENGDVSVNVADHFALVEEGQTYLYKVAITWEESENDMAYMGGAERMSVRVVGTQA